MQAHGGTIRGVTRNGGGASFVLTLPRGEPPSDDGGQLNDTSDFIAQARAGAEHD
jgi:two-component system sensor histidine kinase KdpD